MKRITLGLFALLLSAGAHASPGCYEPLDGTDPSQIATTEQTYAEQDNIMDNFMMCATQFISIMPTSDIFGYSCPDGSKPCEKAINEFCDVDDKGVVFGKGVSALLCMPFKPFL